MNLVDTSGWLEYFFAEPNARYFTAPIEATGDLIVPVICLYEVFKKVNAVADEARSLQAVAQMKQGRVVDVTEDGGTSAQTLQVNNWIAADIEFVEDPMTPVVATGNTGSWLLMLDPDNNRPAAEMAFLAGFSEPQLFQKLEIVVP